MAKEQHLDLLVLSSERLIYEGKAASVVLPGENGVFEVLPFHKRLLSRLLAGLVIIDKKAMRIKRGVVKVGLNRVTVIVEETG